MFRSKGELAKLSGFTLLELLVAIAIIGVLAAVIIASLNDSRRKSRNSATLTQIGEYQKALELYYLNNGFYPHNWFGNNRARVACFGDGLTTEDCLANVTFGASHNSTYSDEIENAISQYMSSLPRHSAGSFSGPAYSGCTAPAPYFWNTAGSCSVSDYSIWFLLEGTNQDCTAADQVYADFQNEGKSTLCRLQK